MINVSRTKFLFLSIFSLSGIIILGAAGYRYITAYSKKDAETFLFGAIIFSLLITILFLHSLIKSRDISREMERLIHLSSIGGFTPGTSLKRLGKLGEQINDLYFHMNSMSKKRSTKIIAQSSLIDFVTTNTQIPLVTTDPTGKILYASKSFLDKNDTAKNEVVNKSIDQFLPNISIKTLYDEMNASHTFSKYKGNKESAEIYPVTGSNNEIAYLVFVFDKHKIQASHQIKDTKHKTLYSFLKKVVSR